MGKLTFSMGGVHPHDSKYARECAIEELPLPQTVYVSMAQHLGAPAKPLVAVGDSVKVGQVIAEPGGFISAFVHSPVSGTVKAIAPRKDLAGNFVTHVEIAVEGDEWDPAIDRSKELVTAIPDDKAAILDKIKAAGVVGLGGATFPAHVKLNPAPGKVAECLILNGAECEPFLTSDYRIMVERPKEIVVGAAIMQKVLGGCQCVIGIEENKPEAIAAMGAAVRELGYPGIEVKVLKKRYPQGGEKQLCQAITGKQVPPGGLPSAIGCAVFNINSVCSIYKAVTTGMPVVKKVVTVSGSGVNEPKNLECPIGTPVSLLFDACGGLKDNTFKIIAGGPMMGMAQYTADISVAKGTGALLAFAGDENKVSDNPTCIRCGRCVDACPMHLQPLYLYMYVQKGLVDELNANNIMDCMECGACAYICPGRLHLTQSFKAGKQMVKDDAAKKKAAAEAAKAAEEKKGA